MSRRTTDPILWAVILAVSLLADPPAAWSQPAGRRWAFLVACADYEQTEFRPLRYSVQDILEFHKALLEDGVPRVNIVLMHDRQTNWRLLPETEKIRQQLDLLLNRVRAGDTLIVALAGHGLQFKGEKHSYFCPVDARPEERQTLLSMKALYEQLEACSASRKLLLVDACRNDPRSVLARSRREVHVQYGDEVVPGGIVALFSCSRGQRSFEHPELGHGVFFYHLLQGWDGAADANRDQQLTYDELAAYATTKTGDFAALKLNTSQTPEEKNEGQARGWVLRTLRDELHRFEGHQAPVRGMALSPDGRYALSGDFGGTTRLWEVATGKTLRTFQQKGWVYCVAFSPAADLILTGGDNNGDNAVRVWKVETGEQVRCLTGHTDHVWCAAFVAAGRRLVSGSADGTLRLWDLETGKSVREFRGHLGTVKAVAVATDGRQLLSGGDDRTVRLWDVETGREMTCFRGHSEPVRSLALSPDGTRAVTGAQDRTLRYWDLRSGKEVRVQQTQEKLISVAFAPDGRRILSGDDAGGLQLWEADTGKELRCFDGHKHNVLNLAFFPDGQRALSSGEDGTLRLWRLPR